MHKSLARECCSRTSTGSIELDFGLGLTKNTSVSVMGRSESGSAWESQSQTRGTSKQMQSSRVVG